MAISEDKQNQAALATGKKESQTAMSSDRVEAANQLASELKTLAMEAPTQVNPNTQENVNQELDQLRDFGMEPERRLENFGTDRTAVETTKDAVRALTRGGVGLVEMAQGASTRLASAPLEELDTPKATYQTAGVSDYQRVKKASEAAKPVEQRAKERVERFQKERGRSESLHTLQTNLKASRSTPLKLRESVANDKIEARKESRKGEIDAKKKAGTWTTADAAIEVGKEFVDATSEYLNQPSLIVDMGIENAVDIIAGGAVGKLGGFIAKTPAQAAKIAGALGVSSAMAQEGLSNANEIQLDILDDSKYTHDDLMKDSPSYSDMLDSGMTPEEARIKLSQQAYDTTFLITTVATGVISKLTGAGDFVGNMFRPKSQLSDGFMSLTKSRAVGGALAEYTEEALQSGSGEVAKNLATQQTVDKDQELTKGVGTQAALGSLAGGLIGGSVGAVQDSVAALDKAGETYVQKAEKRAAATEKQADAVETGNIDTVTNTDAEDFDLKVALTSIQQRADKEGVTPEEVESNFKEANRVWGEYVNKFVHTKEASIEQMKAEGKPKTEIMKAERELANNRKVGKQLAPVMTAMREKFLASQEEVEAATQGDTDATKRVMGSIKLSPDSISVEQSQALLDSGTLSESDAVMVQAAHNYNVAVKSLEQVSTDVFKGGEGKLGLDQYKDIISGALISGDTATVNQYSAWLNNFAEQRINKAEVALAAQNETNPQERDDYLASINLRPGGISGRLVENLHNEAMATIAMRDLMNAQINEVTTDVRQDDEPVDGLVEQLTPVEVDTSSDTTDGTDNVSGSDDSVRPTDLGSGTVSDLDADATTEVKEVTDETTTETASEVADRSTDGEETAAEVETDTVESKPTLAERLTTSELEPSTERLTPEQAEEKFKSSNIVKEKFIAVTREGITQNPLQTETEFMTELAVDTTIALEHVNKEELTPIQMNLLQQVADLHLNDTGPAFDALFQHKPQFMASDYMQYLADENGQIDDNVKAAFTLAVVNWVATKGSDTLFNDFKAINGITSRDTDAFVPGGLVTLLQNVGTTEANVIEDLGQSVVQAIGIKASKEAGGNAQTALEQSAGTFALAMLEEMGLVQNEAVTAQDIENLVAMADSRDAAVMPGKVHFVSIKNKDFLETMSEVFTGSENILQDLFQVESYKTGPKLEEPTQVVVKQKGTNQNVPKAVVKVLKKHQKRKHYVKSDTNRIYGMLDDNAKRALMGYVEDATTVQQHNRDGVEGKNRQIDNSIAHWDTFTNELGDEAKPFFFEWEQWKNLRLGIKSNTVNPQGDKLHRHLLYVGDQNQTLDKNNTAQMEYLYVALAQGLDIDIDKQTNAVSVKQFHELMATKEMKLAIGTIQDALYGTGQLNQEVLMAAIKKGGVQAHSLEALVTYADFLGSTGDTFTTSYSIEADGVTNGPAIATIQFAVGMDWDDVKSRLKRVGIGMDGDTQEYGDWKSNPLNDDNYQSIGRKVQGYLEGGDTPVALQNLFGILVGSLTKEIDGGIAVDKAGRNIPKNPLMTAIYGSGKKAIQGSMGHMVVQNFYDYIEKNQGDRQKLIDLGVAMNNAFGKGTVDKSLVHAPLEFVLDAEYKLEQVGIETYGDAIWESIQEDYAEFMEQRTLVNQSMKVVFELFNEQYNHLVQVRTDEMTEAGLLNPKRETLPEYVREEILKELLDAQPIMNNYYSNISKNISEGLYVGKMEKANPTSKDISKFRTEQVYANGKKKQTNARTRQYTDGGVSPTVLAVQSTDAATMIQTLNQSGVLNVHDAIFTGLKDAGKDVEGINANFMDVMGGYSIITAASDALKRAVVQADKFDTEYGTNMFESTSTLGGHLEVIMGEGLYEKDRAQNPNQDWGDVRGTLNSFVSMVNKTAHITDNRKKEIHDNISYASQYYMEGAGLERDTPEVTESWFERPVKELPQVAAYVRLTGSYKNSKKRLTAAVDSMIEQAKTFPSEPKYDALINALELFKGKYTKQTVRASLESFNQKQQDFIVNRLNAHKEGQSIDTNTVSKEEYNPSWEQREMGSTEKTIHEDDFTAIRTEQVSKDSAETLFDSLEKVGRKTESPEHRDALRSHIKQVVSKVLEPLNVHLADTLGATYGSIKGEDVYIYTQMTGESTKTSEAVINSGIAMSAQEVLAHELTHSVLREGIEGNSLAKKELRKIFDYVKRTGAVTVRDLAESDSVEDMARAQETHDYIFTVRTEAGTRYSNYLHEFATFALTNEKVMAALEKATIPPAFNARNKNASWVQQVRDLFDSLMNLIEGRLSGVKSGQPLKGTIRSLALNLANVESANKHKLLQYADTASSISLKGLNLANTGIHSAAVKMGASNLLANSKFRLVRAVGNVLRTRYTAVEQFIERLNQTKLNHGTGRQGIVGSIITEALGRTLSTARFHDLSRKKNYLLDHARKEIESNTIGALTKSFTMVLEDKHKVAITKAALKTDLELLLDYYEVSDIDKMLRSPTKLNEAIDAVKTELLKDTNGIWYVNSAQALGVFMATGNVYEAHTLMNARNISRLQGLDLPIPTNAKTMEKHIDQLASLYAMVHTAEGHKNTLSEIIRTDKDGFQFTMDLHKQMKADDKKNLFAGEEHSIIKGYTRELTDGNRSVMIATMDQAEELQRQGYVRVTDSVTKDKHDGTTEPVYMWVNEYGGHVAYAAGIFSLTSKKAKGTDTINVRKQSGSKTPGFSASLDNHVILKNKMKQAKEMRTKLTTSTKPTGNLMVPVIDSHGDVSSYRYLMNEQTKDATLLKHNNFDAVLGAMASNSLDKENTVKVNDSVVMALREQYLEDIKFIPEAYLEVSPTSDDPVLREYWSTLPKEAQQAANKAFKGNRIMVRRDLAPIVFGYRKLSVANTFQLADDQKNMVQQHLVNFAEFALGERAAIRLRKAEDMIQEFIKESKEFIVVKSGLVTLMNAVSNSMQLSFEGVSWANIAKYQAEAYREARQYRKDNAELWDLEKRRDVGYQVDLERIAELNHAIATNPISPLIEDGMLQTIVEDIETVEDKFSHKGKASEAVSRYAERLPKGVKAVADFAYLTHDQTVFKLLNEAAQLSDFVSRYALYKHKVDVDGMSHDDAAGHAMDVFINYDMPTNPLVQYLNDMGLVWFTKYYFRVQKVIVKNFIENPARLMLHMILSAMTPWSTPTILDSIMSTDSLGNRFHLPNNPLDMIANSAPLQPFQ